ncbi:hypothetical protein H2203_002529 [Taxawa tesnikishii (nom. ined.)]|nr:hypothetical protein H2203_002529 [Dothideales sp. JES 119]
MADDNGVKLSDNDRKILFSIMKNLKGDLSIDADFDAVAAECGHKDASITKTRWGQIKRKLKGGNGAPAGGIDKNTPSKKTPVKPKKAFEGGDDAETPTKGKRGRKAKSAVKAEEIEDQYATATEGVNIKEEMKVGAELDAEGEEI